ncbi:MAG: glycogen synthase GlgA [Dehalobacterium sp.]
MDILFAVTESDPFAKTGGLGDVGGSLPMIINRLNCSLRVIMPQYSFIPLHLKKEIRHITSFTLDLGWRRQYCGLNEMKCQGVHYYFIDNEYYFGRDQLYGYGDDGERFAFFSKAVLESLLHMKEFKPDVIHCNDWHTALIPVLIKEYYMNDPFFDGIKTLLTIHNLKHQGTFSKGILGDLLAMQENTPGARSLEFHGSVNYFKGGLLLADAITTVSPTYAREILEPYYGEGLEDMLRNREEKITGILNGIDHEKYDPRTDQNLVSRYPSAAWKNENKVRLQALLDLPVNKNVPLLVIVSRLVDQKGLDLLEQIMEEIVTWEMQLVVLGTGEKKYEEMFSYFAHKYPAKIAVKIMFDEDLARKIYGGGNILLMPSRFEPCGLTQMMAMRYGTIPLVRETGGLKDSVIPYNAKNGLGNGFTFTSYDARELLAILEKAVRLYHEDKKTWQSLEDNALKADFSWEESARKYIGLYRDILI